MVTSGEGVVSVVEELIEAWESDQETVEGLVGDLEVELNRTVIRRVRPSGDEQEVIEGYLDVF